jgi:hypothetical protein
MLNGVYIPNRVSTPIKEILDDLKKAEAKPIRWALRILWWRYVDIVVSGTVIAGLVALFWARFRP